MRRRGSNLTLAGIALPSGTHDGLGWLASALLWWKWLSHQVTKVAAPRLRSHTETAHTGLRPSKRKQEEED